MSNWQKEAIKRFRELHPEISDETWNEVINSVGGSFNHTYKIETTQPLFTLTAEEVEVVKHFLSCDKDVLGMSLPTWERDLMINDLDHILNKIKQWQETLK